MTILTILGIIALFCLLGIWYAAGVAAVLGISIGAALITFICWATVEKTFY